MGNLQKRSLKKPDVAITASSFYLRKQTLSFSNTIETTPLEGNEQANLISNENDLKATNISHTITKNTTLKTIETDIPSAVITNLESVTSSDSLKLLTHSEEKEAKSQLKIHEYTIYDDEKDEFIEIIEEEWEGDRPPPPRKAISSQRKNESIIGKALPNLPNPPEIKKGNSLKKFNQRLKKRYPLINKYKLPTIISLIIFFIILLIIIILAATGAFKNKNDFDSANDGGKSKGNNGGNNNSPNTGNNGAIPPDVGKPGLQINGTGEGTYYDPSVGLGACGKLNTAKEFVGAMNAQQYGNNSNPNDAPICGMCVKITGPKGNVKVKIADKCTTCKVGDIDLSPAAFDVIGDEPQGRIPISWEGCT